MTNEPHNPDEYEAGESGEDLSPEMPDSESPVDDEPPAAESVFDEPFTDQAAPQPGPMYQAPMPVRRLTRDPYSKLGGVASGLAHYYGIDVSLVRLAVVAFSVVTGIGFLLYLAAWLVIPRAEVWPPPPPSGGHGSRVVDNRQLAIGLVAIGLLVAVYTGGGIGSQLLIALALVGGGVWLFNQRPTAAAPAEVGGPVPTGGLQPPYPGNSWEPPVTDDGASHAFRSSNPGGSVPPNPPHPPNQGVPAGSAFPPPQPVQRRRRRIWPILLVGLAILLPLTLIFGGLAAFLVVEGGDVSFETSEGGTIVYEATSPDDLPDSIREGVGEMVVDLSALDIDDFDNLDLPVKVNVEMTAGEVTVDLPADMPVDVTADVGAAGEIEIFGEVREGLRPQHTVSESDPVLELTVHVGAGRIEVAR